MRVTLFLQIQQIIQSKRRFQKGPTNFALRKAELMKQRDMADDNGESEDVRRLDLELDELETQAERIDRRRTIGFKSINSINQRNRILSVKQAEDAIIREAVEDIPRSEDPFTRIQSSPVIVTKSYLERLRRQKVCIYDFSNFCRKIFMVFLIFPPMIMHSERYTRQPLINGNVL